MTWLLQERESVAMADEQEDHDTPMLQIGDEFPNLSCPSTSGFIELHDAIANKWTLLFTTPKDLNAVTTSALAEVSKLKEEFDARGVEIIALGVDTNMNHRDWIKETKELTEEKITFPIIVDDSAQISRALGLCRPNEPNIRRSLIPLMLAVVIDPELKIQLLQYYPVSIGHNFYEILRAIDSMQLSREHKIATPANWMVGEDVFIVPDLGRYEAADEFPNGFLEIRSWFRLTGVPESSPN